MKIIGDKESLKKEIINDAERKKKQAIKKANNESKKIIKQARDQANEQYEKTKQEGLDQAEKAKQQILSSIPQAVKKKNIEMMNALVDEVMEEIDSTLKNMKNSEVKPIELSLLRQCLDKLDTGKYTVNTSGNSSIADNDLKNFEKEFGLKLEINKQKEQGVGVIISGEDHRMALDNTIEGKINRDIEEVRYIIYNALFSDIENEIKEKN